MAQGEPQVIELFLRRREQKIALIARGISGGVKLCLLGPDLALDVMPRRHTIGLKVFGRLQQVLELDPLVAANARHRGRPAQIAVGELVDHGILEDVLVIQNVVGKPHLLGHAAGIMNVAPRTAGTFLGQSGAMVIKLQGDAHHVIAFLGQFGGHDGAVHAA